MGYRLSDHADFSCGWSMVGRAQRQVNAGPASIRGLLPQIRLFPFDCIRFKSRIIEINRVRCPMRFRLTILVVAAIALLSVGLSAQQIRGDYIETRSADVYTGQCFANGEVNLVGKEAIVAWHVQNGSWDGVPLQGLTVAAAVRAKGPLGAPYENPYPAKAVLEVHDQANPQQQGALL